MAKTDDTISKLCQMMSLLEYDDLITLRDVIDQELNNKREFNQYALVHQQLCTALLFRLKYSKVNAMRDWRFLTKASRKKFSKAWAAAAGSLKIEGIEKEVVNQLIVKLVREDPLLKNPDLESLICSLDRIIYTLDRVFPEYRKKQWIPMLNEFLKTGQSDWFKK